MKTLLRLLGVGVLTTVAACRGGKNSNSGVAMNAKVSQYFGFVDAAGTSKVEVTVSFAGNVASWNSLQLATITAAKLLAIGSEDTPKAVSVAAGDFLVNAFKLKVVARTGADRTFTRSEAELIAMLVKTWSPTIAKVGTTDYVISGGTAVVQLKKRNRTIRCWLYIKHFRKTNCWNNCVYFT